MSQPDNTIPVLYLNVGAPGSENISQQGGSLVLEMCPKCYAMAPTDLIQQHIDQPHAGEDQTPNWQLGQNLENRPDQGLPPEPGSPSQGNPGTPEQQPS
jgi:hypothetical protein